MPFHMWGDSWEHWNDLSDAIGRFSRTCKKYGRINMQPKEKYGTLRDQSSPWDGTLFSLMYPGYCWVPTHVQSFYYNIDYPILRKLFWRLGVVWLVRKWQAAVYNYAIQRECKRCPGIVDEMVSDLDMYEWVTPGLFGDVCGKTVHKKHWRSFNEADAANEEQA